MPITTTIFIVLILASKKVTKLKEIKNKIRVLAAWNNCNNNSLRRAKVTNSLTKQRHELSEEMFDCLLYEMLYVKDIKPSFSNKQADSIRVKLFP